MQTSDKDKLKDKACSIIIDAFQLRNDRKNNTIMYNNPIVLCLLPKLQLQFSSDKFKYVGLIVI